MAAQVPGRIGSGGGLEARPALGAGERIYAGLLHAYPREFRRRYEQEMVVLFGDQLRDARAAGGSGGIASAWIRTLLDLVSSAVGEHLRRDRDVAQSLTTYQPTISMRLLGLFGIVGAVLLLWVFVFAGSFADLGANRIRLIWFALAGAAISLAFYRRAAHAAPFLALLTTGAVVIAGIWYSTWIVVASGHEGAFVGPLGLVNMLANIALWVSPAAWAIGLLHTGAAWAGMGLRRRLLTKLGLALLIGSIVGWLGDDRLGMVDSLWGELWQAVALTGVAMNGLGWLILGLVLVVPERNNVAEA